MYLLFCTSEFSKSVLLKILKDNGGEPLKELLRLKTREKFGIFNTDVKSKLRKEV